MYESWYRGSWKVEYQSYILKNISFRKCFSFQMTNSLWGWMKRSIVNILGSIVQISRSVLQSRFHPINIIEPEHDTKLNTLYIKQKVIILFYIKQKWLIYLISNKQTVISLFHLFHNNTFNITEYMFCRRERRRFSIALVRKTSSGK